MISEIMRPLVFLFVSTTALLAQVAAPSSGDVTVRLLQPLDSAFARPNQSVPGMVQKSTNPDVPSGTNAAVLLIAEPSGGYSVHLVRLGLGGQLVRTASAGGVLAGISKLGGFIHDQGVPKTAAAGPRVYLPSNTDVRFTLIDAPPQAPAPAPERAPRRMPPPPQHPANTVVDLPAAGPGYPPIHASHPAQDDCWWIPFLSEKYGFEAAVQTCAKKESTTVVSESEHGLALQNQGSAPTEFVSVLSKPAAQPIEAAIKQQFIMKLKVPAARESCKVVKGPNGGQTTQATSAANPNIQLYSITATGPYSKSKKFQGEDATDVPCPGLQMNDAIAMFFLYDPAESKTKFMFFQEDDNGQVFDQDSIHFKPEP